MFQVWSYAIVLWEMAAQAQPDLLTLCGIHDGPFVTTTIRLLREGRRLPVDADWPAWIRRLMTRCWNAEGKLRPSFADICMELKGAMAQELAVQCGVGIVI